MLDELEEKYDLTYGFLPDDEAGMLEKFKELLKQKVTEDLIKTNGGI